ncbi:MAG: DUF5696 domain-containing protein [Defluviitaleaceae bacterium]|nr:DUF5696 domain-containing protein [Defluviitaleaceae bacterium]
MKKILFLLPLLFLLAACAGASAERPVPELDRSQPIAYSSQFVTVAQSDGVTLQYRADYGYIRVIDANGNIWESTPHDIDDDPLARGQIRMALSSMITVSFLSGANNMSHETAMAASVRQGGLSAYQIPNGVRAEFFFPAQRVMVPVEITLENGTMLAAIHPHHIQRVTPAPDAPEGEWVAYERSFRLTNVGLIPHFVHAGMDSEGYMLVPDGSGALIYLNNEQFRMSFSQPVYGRDRINVPRQVSAMAQDILLPVFGMKRDDAAIFAIIEGGAALATINAGVAGGSSSFNSVGASFFVRPPGSYTIMDAQGVEREIQVTTDWVVDVDVISVRFFFMENGSGYSEMATLYREYLIAQGMTATQRSHGLPLMLDIYGSVTRRMSVLGVPTNRNISLTSFAQSGEMVETLLNAGIENLIVRYNNWLPDGNYSTAPSRFSPNRGLGGNRGFRTFANQMEEWDVALYMDVDFATAHNRPILGFIGSPVIRDVANMQVRQTDFSPSTFMPEDEPYPGWWLYSPRTFENAIHTFVSRASGQNISGLAMTQLSNNPYGDVGRRNPMDRGAAEVLLFDLARHTRAELGGLMGDAAGAFWLPHATAVVNTPLGCSGFGITNRSVPFYQMVLHGYVAISLPAFNLTPDSEGMILRAAETGAMLQLSVMAENPAYLIDTPLEWLFSPSFNFWYQQALDAVHRLAPVYNAVAGSPIVQHTYLSDGVTRTEFANGTVVFVNFGHEEANAEAITWAMPAIHGDGVTLQPDGGIHWSGFIPARDFIVFPGGAQW